MAVTPAGSTTVFCCSCSGGVDALNHRLIAVIPSGYKTFTRIYAEELIPTCLEECTAATIGLPDGGDKIAVQEQATFRIRR